MTKVFRGLSVAALGVVAFGFHASSVAEAACKLIKATHSAISQTEAAEMSRALALRRKLGATGGTGDYIAKPKGMHWRTFERAMARIRRAEDIVERFCSVDSRGRFQIKSR